MEFNANKNAAKNENSLIKRTDQHCQLKLHI